MQNIVTETENDAKKAIEFLKRKDAGRATFLPMSTIKGSEIRENDLESSEGFVGVASDLCDCDEKYKNILRSLLGRICVADNLDNAVGIAKRYGYRFRIVTLDGQVINAGGSLTGGSRGKKTGLLSRVSEIEKEKKNLSKLNAEIESLRKLYVNAQSESGAAQAKLNEARDRLASVKEEKFRVETEMKTSSDQIVILTNDAEVLKQEKSECLSRISELEEAFETAQGKLSGIEKDIEKAQSKIEVVSDDLREQTEKREILTDKLSQIKLQIVTITKDIEIIDGEIRNALTQNDDNRLKKQAVADEIEQVKKDNKQIEKTIYAYRADVSKLRHDSAYNNERIAKLSEERAKLEKRSAQLRKLERERSDEKENIVRELARLEERKANLQKQYDDINRKLWEEYELTARQAKETAVPIENITAAQKRLSELKSKIKSLGSVNVAAIDEYKEVSERYEFMKAQVGDVEKSKKEILSLINDLTKQMKEIFVQRFAEINRNFGETFTELFGGGKASLSLTNEEDILGSGIEITCHPPGKLVSHLELLSGGERALVAIALYFAIMKVSPAPFCVMDEIEAALDEVNVDRFAQYLRRMNDNTQFILITHRRGTMEEADVLYGVTMQDEGISKLLELHSSEVAASFTNIK